MNNNTKVSGEVAGKLPRKPPKFLNLLQIRLPVTGVASIAHRISGVLLFLSIPFLIYSLELSLDGPQGFARMAQFADNLWIVLFLLLLLWSVLHHFSAGIRYLFLDVDVGVSKRAARASAWWVLLLPVILTLTLAVLFLSGGDA